jgi:glycosyltransferase involved in cell wall biosynthesis
MKKKTLCLNMIVKNEEHVILRCLEQVVPFIDYYVIVDTGSTDRTPKVIRDFFDGKGVPGEVVVHDFGSCSCHDYQYDFFHFGLNRTYAIEQCRGKSDYIWVMDADDTIQGEFNFKIPELEVADTYHLILGSKQFTYTRPLIFRNDPTFRFRFEGPLHEYLTSDRPLKSVVYSGNYYIESGKTGDRSRDPEKYRKDALIFEQVMDPNGRDYLRHLYYCGQSWKDYGDHERAIKWFQERTRHQGWNEELFCAHWELIKLYQRTNRPWPEIEDLCLEAHRANPRRAESLHCLAQHYRQEGQLDRAHEYATRATKIPYREEGLFVMKSLYQFDIPFELAECCFQSKRYLEALGLYQRLVKEREVHQNVHLPKRIEFCQKMVDASQREVCGLYLGHEPVTATLQELIARLESLYEVIAFTDHYRLDCRVAPVSRLKNRHLDLLVVYNQLQVPPNRARRHFLIQVGSRFRRPLNRDLELEINSHEDINAALKRFQALYHYGGLEIDLNYRVKLESWNGHELLKPQPVPDFASNQLPPRRLLKPPSVVKLEQSALSEDFDELVEYYRQQPQDVVVQRELARLYREKGATESLRTLVDGMASKSGWFRMEKARLKFEQGHHQDGYRLACETLREERPSSSSYVALAEEDRPWAEKIRDRFVDHVKESTAAYPSHLPVVKENRHVMLSITSCKRIDLFKKTVNSFINCCQDIDRIGYWFCVDDNSSQEDRDEMARLYPFIDFHQKAEDEKGHCQSMNLIWRKAGGFEYLLHLEDDWHFVESRPYVTESIRILESDPTYIQVLFNRNTAEVPNYQRPISGGVLKASPRHVIHEHCPAKSLALHRFKNRYGSSPSVSYWPHFSFRPSVIRVSCLERIGLYVPSGFFERYYADEATSLGYQMVYLDTFSCIHIGKKTWERAESNGNAYTLNGTEQFAHNQQEVNSVAVTTRHWTPQWKAFKESAKSVYQLFRPEFDSLSDEPRPLGVGQFIDKSHQSLFKQLFRRYAGKRLLVMRDRLRPKRDFGAELPFSEQEGVIGCFSEASGSSVLERLRGLDCFWLRVPAEDPERLERYRFEPVGDSLDCPYTVDSSVANRIDEELEAPVELPGYRFYPAQDSIGGDLKYQSLEHLASQHERIREWGRLEGKGFNTLGYLKSEIKMGELKTLPFSLSIQDGLYVKEEAD